MALMRGLTEGNEEGVGRCCDGIHLINGAVMLSEAKHLWSTPLEIGRELIRDSCFAQNDTVGRLLC
jgi:hypothetical protein